MPPKLDFRVMILKHNNMKKTQCNDMEILSCQTTIFNENSNV